MQFYIIYEKYSQKTSLFKKPQSIDDVKNIVAFTSDIKYAKIYIDGKNLYIKEAYMDDINYKNLTNIYSNKEIKVYRISGTDDFSIMTEYDKIKSEQEVELSDYIKQRATIYN